MHISMDRRSSLCTEQWNNLMTTSHCAILFSNKQAAKNFFSRSSYRTETGSCFPPKYLSSKSNKPGVNVSLKSSMALQDWNITSVDLIEELLMLILKVWAITKVIFCFCFSGKWTTKDIEILLFNLSKILLKPLSVDAWRQISEHLAVMTVPGVRLTI